MCNLDKQVKLPKCVERDREIQHWCSCKWHLCLHNWFVLWKNVKVVLLLFSLPHYSLQNLQCLQCLSSWYSSISKINISYSGLHFASLSTWNCLNLESQNAVCKRTSILSRIKIFWKVVPFCKTWWMNNSIDAN